MQFVAVFQNRKSNELTSLIGTLFKIWSREARRILRFCKGNGPKNFCLFVGSRGRS